MRMRHVPLVCAVVAPAALANTAPTPEVVSAAMRPGTTLMDVVFRGLELFSYNSGDAA